MSEEFIPNPGPAEGEAAADQQEAAKVEPSDQLVAENNADGNQSAPSITDEVKEEAHANGEVLEAHGDVTPVGAAKAKAETSDAIDTSEIVAAAAASRAQALASQFASEASNADQSGTKRKIEDEDASEAPDAKRHEPEFAPALVPDASGEFSEVLNAPADKIGRLIGRGGATIQAIQARGGARIKVQHDAIGGLKPVTLNGTPESVARTKALCLQALETGSIEGGPIAAAAPTYTPAPAPAISPSSAPKYLPSSASMVLFSSGGSGNEPSSRKISCPSHMIGRVIGRGGETIRSLQTASSAAIKINQNFPEGQPREIELSGTFDSIQRAHDMILEIINSNGQATTNALINQFGKGLVREIACPKTSIGRVIGKGGETVKGLQRQHQCTIQIDQSAAGPCKITITGDQSNVMTAERAVMDLIEGGTNPGMGGYGGGGGGGRPMTGAMGGYGPAPGAPPPHYPPAGGGHWPQGQGYGAWGAGPASYPGQQPYGAWAPGAAGGYGPPSGHPQPAPGGYGPAPVAGGYPGQPYGGWAAPVDPYGQRQAQAPAPYGQQGPYAAPAPAPAPAGPPPRSAWQELKDDQNRPYYYNTTTGVSQWERPRDM